MPPLPASFRAFSLLLGVTPAVAATAPPLSTAAEVLSLPAEQASARLPITIRGVVTAAEPDWSGQFFVQDETGGVFVENLRQPAPAPGDVVSVRGVSHPGAFAPIVSEPQWERTGTASLPVPKQPTIDNLEAGVEDGERVEVAGVVRAVRVDGTRLNLDLAVSGYRLQVRAPAAVAPEPAALIAARIRVRGTAATHYNAALRHLTAVAVYVPRAEDFAILEPEAADPFSQPVIAINALAQYRRDHRAGRRLHVRGTLTLQRRGEDVFLQDESGGIRVLTSELRSYAPAQQLDAVGFLEFESHLPVLRDAVLRSAGPARTERGAPRVPGRELLEGRHCAELIALRGRVLDHSIRPLTRPGLQDTGTVSTWVIQGDSLSFVVERENTPNAPVGAAPPPGSIVEAVGVCFPTVDSDGKLRALQVLLPSEASLAILAKPSWLTAERLLVGVGLLSAVLLLVLGWLLTLSRKNGALRAMLRELEQAQRALQEAHDTLEQKVAERSAQLQVEMTARRAGELQFKAVLAERTRLARDLHDTLEQTLTGIALQLDTAARLFASKPEGSRHHLQLARRWLRQSQVELRRSIWDLRSRELEQFDLAGALRQSAESLVDGLPITLEFRTEGAERQLPEVVEENVLRIGQEAVTNAVKHAGASRLGVSLTLAEDRLVLRVQDDGIGFESPRGPAPTDNHFGLLGMSERAKRLEGRLAIESAPGRGCTITVEVPLESPTGGTTVRNPCPSEPSP